MLRWMKFAMLFLAGSAAVAAEPAPDELMKAITDDVVEAIRRDKDIQKGDPRKIAALVETRILPHFDFRRATQIALGSNWRHASPEQQEALTREFRSLLVRTYSGALAAYRGQKIEYLPLRARPGDAEVTVRSRIRQPGSEPIAVEYDMARSAAGWMVYDVRIGGMSLVANYRSAFAEQVRNYGIDGLIDTLSGKNRQTITRVEHSS